MYSFKRLRNNVWVFFCFPARLQISFRNLSSMSRQIGLSSPVNVMALLNTVSFQLLNQWVTRKHFTAEVVFSAVERILWNCRIIQVKRDLRKAQSRVGYEIRPGYSEIYPVISWKLPRMETVQTLWITCSSPWLSAGWKSFLLRRVWISSLNSCLFLFLTLYAIIKSLSVFSYTPCRYWGAATSFPWKCPFPRLSKSWTFSPSSHDKCSSPPAILGALWTPGFVGACLVLKGPKLGSVIQVWSNECWAEGADHFPGCSTCAPVQFLAPATNWGRGGSWAAALCCLPQGCVCRAAPGQSSPVCTIAGKGLYSQMLDFLYVLAELHEVSIKPFLHPV